MSAGPLGLATAARGPFFGISGYWCWISDSYGPERIVLDYLMMFLSASFSFLLYSLVFLRLRGNILLVERGIRFRSVDKSTAWQIYSSQSTTDTHHANVVSVAKHMLLYPVAYTILLVPIAACRFAEWTGREVPLGGVIFSDGIFLLSGLVNTTLFVTTRRILTLGDILAMLKRPSSSAVLRKSSVTSSMLTIVKGEEDDEPVIIGRQEKVDDIEGNSDSAYEVNLPPFPYEQSGRKTPQSLAETATLVGEADSENSRIHHGDTDKQHATSRSRNQQDGLQTIDQTTREVRALPIPPQG